jgi:hypothetical protein
LRDNTHETKTANAKVLAVFFCLPPQDEAEAGFPRRWGVCCENSGNSGANPLAGLQLADTYSVERILERPW